MTEWFGLSSFQISVCLLFSGLILQTMAAILAAHWWIVKGSRRVALGLFCLALALMIPLCWRPLELALRVGIYDLPQAVLSFGAALLLFLAVVADLPPQKPPLNKTGQGRRKTPENRP